MIEGSYQVLVPSYHAKQGLVAWRNHNGATILQLHYSADPEKTDEWAEQAAKKYPGGIDGSLWQQEMEIEAEARYGRKVFQEFSVSSHVVRDFAIEEDAPRWRGIDPGYHDPLACLWFALVGDTVFVYREHYEQHWTLEQHAPVIKARSAKEEYEFTFIDPSAYKDTLEGGTASVADRFAKLGMKVVPANRARRKYLQIPALAELMRLHENGEPRLKIFESCHHTIREVSGYRWREQSEFMVLNKNAGETPIDKDDHTVDVLLYFASTIDPSRVRARRRTRFSMRVEGRHGSEDYETDAAYVGMR